ncbi:MAG TPA: YitT family protein, partial [Saprospiraceae bacterium]|nr:YitT family protein [Saprospiraceae bacterium]
MNFEALKEMITRKLSSELSPTLLYHSYEHTMEVFHAALRYAEAEGVTGDDLTLLLTAVLFHDSGFILQAEDHEEHSCNLAKEILPQYDYTPDQIDKICGMIRSTKIPQNAKTHLEQILCDADLDYLGREEYTRVANHLYEEMSIAGMIKGEKDWIDQQIRFLENHTYYTPTAKKWRDETKAANLHALKIKSGAEQARPVQLFSPKQLMEYSFREIMFIVLGVLSFTFGLRGLLIPNHFFDGGVTGTSLLIREYTHFNIAVIIVLANIPFIIFSAYQVDMRFAVKTFLAMLALGLS